MASGCFVADELESGQAIMDKNSPRGAAKKEEPKAASRKGKDDSGSVLDSGRDALASVESWWDELGEPEPPAEDGIVRCQVHGSLQFTRESDCRARGGHPVE